MQETHRFLSIQPTKITTPTPLFFLSPPFQYIFAFSRIRNLTPLDSNHRGKGKGGKKGKEGNRKNELVFSFQIFPTMQEFSLFYQYKKQKKIFQFPSLLFHHVISNPSFPSKHTFIKQQSKSHSIYFNSVHKFTLKFPTITIYFHR